MPVATNPSFDRKNIELQKRPLYVVTIEGVLEPLTTFRPEEAQVTWGGYGIGGYGTTGYGY
ncbi:MAG: hypothetical protein MUP80_15880 [Acidobacteriia bacterium]|jgi:hypothetical protein|nr:hypothetical protein [Terriglobia bacterium]